MHVVVQCMVYCSYGIGMDHGASTSRFDVLLVVRSIFVAWFVLSSHAYASSCLSGCTSCWWGVSCVY